MPAGTESKALIDNVQVKKVYAPIFGYYYSEDFGNQKNTTEVIYEKVHPAEYKVNIQAKSPFFLIFNETYDSNWDATIDGKKIGKHFKVNSYANGYFIDRTGNFQILLTHGSWYVMNYSLYISILALFIALVFLLI